MLGIRSALTDRMHQLRKRRVTLADHEVDVIGHDRVGQKQCIGLLQCAPNDRDDFGTQLLKPIIAGVRARRDVKRAAWQIGSLSPWHGLV